MLLVIQTQNEENYGAHDWDGTGACPQYWKMKGGQEYKVINLPEGANIDQVVELVRSDIEMNNEGYRSYIVGYGLEADDYLSWFEKSQLEWDGEITHPEPVIDYQLYLQAYQFEYADWCANNDAQAYGEIA
jgi:hypothetical protein